MLKAMALGIVKPLLKRWLTDRALRLPEPDALALAARCNISVYALYEINDEVAEHIAAELDKVKL